ncbi:hypothetical protein GN244_ATG18965 [Phytophthora infestans]|uniref:HAT C-terminal dimerisation domain-containing protein n=1 Tax=Phytophthora infestans TaxID=4787 RepID=A0A833RYT9_PHYIN|nr:hypothetical protein GN244_ATG18965 [Phytophthora infestans]
MPCTFAPLKRRQIGSTRLNESSMQFPTKTTAFKGSDGLSYPFFEPDGKGWLTIKCLLAILDPIAATSELLGGQGYPTLALAYPCLRQIQRTLERDDLFDEETSRVRSASYKNAVLDLMTNVRLAFSDLFRKRFEDIPAELLWISYLDPRLTNMEGLSREEAVKATNGLIDATIDLAMLGHIQLAQQMSDQDESIPCEETSAISKKQRTIAIEGVFGKRVQHDSMSTNSARERRIRTHCTAEVYRYLDEVEDVTFDVDPLEWWRTRGSEFPKLTPLA